MSKHPRTGLLMSRVKWCLAMHQQFVLVLVTLDETVWRFQNKRGIENYSNFGLKFLNLIKIWCSMSSKEAGSLCLVGGNGN